MSAAVKAAMQATKDLGKNERLVAIAIAAHANAAGDAWPSVATIADYVDCSERTVQRALAKLVSLGRLVVRTVKGIVTRVYRLVLGVTKTGPEVTDQQQGATETGPGGDSHGVSPEVVKPIEKKKGRADARDWRRFLPKSNNPERRGAALPPAPGGDRCPKPGHVGQIANNCGPCRSEEVGK